jgi:arsenical pump membrane protein
VSVDVEPAAGNGEIATPTFALTALGLTLVGFGVSSLFGVEPVWVALAGALVLGARALAAGRIRPGGIVRAADPAFCLFVLALAVVVLAVAGHGLGMALAAVLPTAPTLGGLLLVAALAAVLSNVLNNLPAALLLLAVLGDAPAPGVVLAALIGVNVGPNLSYLGSLATLLWRRALNGTGAAPGIGEFTALGVLTVPPALLAAVVTMWATLPLVTP